MTYQVKVYEGNRWVRGSDIRTFESKQEALEFARRELARDRLRPATRARFRYKISKTTEAGNPEVYDSNGKLVGKFSRKTAKIVARVVGGTIGKRRNPNGRRFEYGLVVHGNTALSKAGFKSLQDAKQYRNALYVRGLLFGRSTEILKIDNENMSSERAEYKAYNPGRSRLFPTREAAVAYARAHRRKGQKVFLQRVKRGR